MNIVVCFKLVPDNKDIEIKPNGDISLEKAEWILGGNDLQAVEAAVRLAEKSGGKVIALSAGCSRLNHPDVKKNILSRGPAELYLVTDEAMENADTHFTARVLAAAVCKISGIDLVVCGEGSSDLNFQQVGLQIGELLGIPTINAVSAIEFVDGKITVHRSLEKEIEVLEIPLPAALAVSSEINQPRLPTMRDSLQAIKKPAVKWSLDDLELSVDVIPCIKVLGMRSPQQKSIKQGINFPLLLMLDMIRSAKLASRKQVIISGTAEEAANTLVDYLDREEVL